MAEIKVVSYFPLGGGRAIEEVALAGRDWEARVASIRRHPSVRSLSVLESSSDHARARIEVASCPLARAVAESGVTPRLPFEVRDGYERWLIVAERAEAARFVEALRAQGVEASIVSSREHRPHEGLTDRQRELLRAAVEHGYYEVPRRVTLTQLAQRLHVAKSTLSETLARGERRLLDELSPWRA